MSNLYHATPYDISATGFYFKTYEEYSEKASKHMNEYGQHVEEYEMQFIDGENCELFKALSVNQATLKDWFNNFESMEESEAVKAIALAEYYNDDVENILDRMDDICLFEGTAEEYAESYIEDTGLLNELPENLRYYFDTQAFARDMLLNGDISEITVAGTDYIVWGG